MTSGFNKAIEELIVKRFPFILDYDIVVDWDVYGTSWIKVNYHLDPELINEITSDDFDFMRETTKSLFKMMNPGNEYRFDGVGFIS